MQSGDTSTEPLSTGRWGAVLSFGVSLSHSDGLIPYAARGPPSFFHGFQKSDERRKAQ